MSQVDSYASKGAEKLRRKAQQMINSWNAARTRMVEGYRAAGFGPTRTANYQAGIQAATYPGSNPDKYQRNYAAKMKE